MTIKAHIGMTVKYLIGQLLDLCVRFAEKHDVGKERKCIVTLPLSLSLISS